MGIDIFSIFAVAYSFSWCGDDARKRPKHNDITDSFAVGIWALVGPLGTALGSFYSSMAQTKNQLIRVIDRCLRSPISYSANDMMEKCNIALVADGRKPVTSKVTILEDLNGIMNSFPDAKIVTKKVGRNVYYEYEDKTFSIYNIPLSDDEMAQLAQTVSILSKFEGMPNFDWVDDLIDRFKSSLNIPTTRETIVAFDENFDLRGRSWFAKLFSAIASQQALEIKYKPFGRPLKTYSFHPYLLKQYNNRWFLIGCIEGRSYITNLPLDRIEDIAPAAIDYRPNTGTCLPQVIFLRLKQPEKADAPISSTESAMISSSMSFRSLYW